MHTYKPIQPSVAKEVDISYSELFPSSAVAKYVYCYWQLKTTKELGSDHNYRVLADGCIDVFFNTNHPDHNLAMGFYRKYTSFSIGRAFSYSGIRFNPSYFTKLFQLDASTLSNKDLPAAQVVPNLARFITSLDSGLDLGVIQVAMDGFLGQYITDHAPLNDDRFDNALLTIYEKKGLLDTGKELNTGLSPRQLRRVFNYYIGSTPKSFAQVVRFQHVVRKITEAEGKVSPSVYLDAGFFDQAHFIKDFKRFYGATPSVAFF